MMTEIDSLDKKKGKEQDDAFYDCFYKGHWRQLSPDFLRQVEQRCKDITFCRSEMLGPEENLIQVLEEDEATLKRLQVDRKQIADVLETIRGLPGGEPVLDGRFYISNMISMGSQRSPFQHPDDKRYFGYESGDRSILVKRLSDGASFYFQDLLIRMIGYNGFFEGKNSDGRLDPKEVVEFFGIRPHVDYSFHYEELKTWHIDTSLYMENKDAEQQEKLSKALALTHTKLSNGATAYLSWLPSLISYTQGPFDHSKIDFDKLRSLPDTQQMIYLIAEGVGRFRPRFPIRKVMEEVDAFRARRSYEDISCLSVEIYRYQNREKSNREVVFGANLKLPQLPSGNGKTLYTVYKQGFPRCLVGWNHSIGT